MKVGDEGVALFGGDFDITIGRISITGSWVAHGIAGHRDHAGRRDDSGVGHEVAGLHTIRFGNPAVEILRRILE